jgi:peroxiredoxin
MGICVTRTARFCGWCISLSVLALGLVACGGPAATGPDPATGAAATSGEPGTTRSPAAKTKKIADFSLETVDGKTVSLSDYVGENVIMLDFWATWCEPCLAAMPHLNQIYRKHKDDGFVLLSISMDGPDTVAEVRSYSQRHNLDFPVLLDEESRAVSLYNPKRSAPFSVLIAKDGTILHKRDGYQPGDEVAIEAEVVEALSR